MFANPGKAISVGGHGNDQILLTGINAKPGTLFPVFVQYGDETGKQLLVPVLDGTLAPYDELLPTNAPQD